jgi:hypothetical protein
MSRFLKADLLTILVRCQCLDMFPGSPCLMQLISEDNTRTLDVAEHWEAPLSNNWKTLCLTLAERNENGETFAGLLHQRQEYRSQPCLCLVIRAQRKGVARLRHKSPTPCRDRKDPQSPHYIISLSARNKKQVQHEHKASHPPAARTRALGAEWEWRSSILELDWSRRGWRPTTWP